jgi:hypothetical protein
VRILDGLLRKLREVCEDFTDRRSTSKNVVYSMADISMSAFAMFFMQCESFLDFQRKLEQRERRSNLHSLFQVKAIPTDPHIRSMLDEVDPESLQPCFDDAVRVLDANGGLETFKRLDGRLLVALDGTEYFCSKKIKCEHCLHRKRRDKTVDYYHTMLAATIVIPEQTHCLHLMPEFIENLDGNDKQDCERNAAKRWLASGKAQAISHMRPVFLGDDLFACQPVAQAIAGIDNADFIFVAKPESHKAVFDFVESSHVETLTVAGPKRSTYTYRWTPGVPMREDAPVFVDWCEITITNASGKITYRNSFVTSLSVDAGNVVEIATCGRTRWKIENESFNVLKNHGYNLAHNFGHGKNNLAKVLAALNLLAFTFHNVCDVLEGTWQRARKKAGKRTSFFNTIFHACAFFIFETWTALITSVITGRLPSPQQSAASP